MYTVTVALASGERDLLSFKTENLSLTTRLRPENTTSVLTYDISTLIPPDEALVHTASLQTYTGQQVTITIVYQEKPVWKKENVKLDTVTFLSNPNMCDFRITIVEAG